MSKKETWRTRKYWSKVGGLLIEEFLAVNASKNSGKRAWDGVIVLNEKSAIFEGNFYNIEDKDIVVIQTKSGRIGMNLLGQAYFSKLLIEKFNPRSLKSIAICEKYDNVIVELAKKHGIEVVVFKDNEYEEKFDDPKYINKNKSFH